MTFYLFFQPIIILYNCLHNNISSFHVKGNLSCFLFLKIEDMTIGLPIKKQFKYNLFIYIKHYLVVSERGTLTMIPILLVSEVNGKIWRM